MIIAGIIAYVIIGGWVTKELFKRDNALLFTSIAGGVFWPFSLITGLCLTWDADRAQKKNAKT